MANCTKCGGKLGIFGGCSNCEKQKNDEIIAARIAERDAFEKAEVERLEQEKLEKERLAEARSAVTITTEQSGNLNITKRFGIVMSSVECVFDVKVPKAQGELIEDLKAEAHNLGANAVVGIAFHFIETYAVNIGVGDYKKFKMVAVGTAVTIS